MEAEFSNTMVAFEVSGVGFLLNSFIWVNDLRKYRYGCSRLCFEKKTSSDPTEFLVVLTAATVKKIGSQTSQSKPRKQNKSNQSRSRKRSVPNGSVTTQSTAKITGSGPIVNIKSLVLTSPVYQVTSVTIHQSVK